VRSKVLHVLNQGALILVTEISPKGMSAILDEVRAETDFQHFLLHTLKRCSVVLGLKFGELLFRRALQDPVHIGLHKCLEVFRVDVHDEVIGLQLFLNKKFDAYENTQSLCSYHHYMLQQQAKRSNSIRWR
jgi:hypothetical protein